MSHNALRASCQQSALSGQLLISAVSIRSVSGYKMPVHSVWDMLSLSRRAVLALSQLRRERIGSHRLLTRTARKPVLTAPSRATAAFGAFV